MISRVKLHHLDLMTWFKTLQIHWIDRWILQSTDPKSIVYWKVKLWLFGQIQGPRIIIHQNMSKYETFLSRNEILKILFWNLKFLNLEIFLSIENFLFFPNFRPNFHHDTKWFKGSSQHESCRSPWNLQLWFTQFLLKMLGSQDIILWIHAHELK